MYEHILLCKYFTRLIFFKLLRATQWILQKKKWWQARVLFLHIQSDNFYKCMCIQTLTPRKLLTSPVQKAETIQFKFFWVSPVTNKQKKRPRSRRNIEKQPTGTPASWPATNDQWHSISFLEPAPAPTEVSGHFTINFSGSWLRLQSFSSWIGKGCKR